jgi:hypothetical protein
MLRSSFVRTGVFLALGAVSAFLVAWWCSLVQVTNVRLVSAGLEGDVIPSWFFQRAIAPGLTIETAQLLDERADAQLRSWYGVMSREIQPRNNYFVGTVNGQPSTFWRKDMTGWPLRSHYCLQEGQMDFRSRQFVQRIVLRGFGVAAVPGRTEWFADRCLPVGIILWGFLGNVLLYSAGIAAVWWCCVYMRQRSRLKRGRCLCCGYDMTGLSPGVACPECGCAPRSSRQHRRSTPAVDSGADG